MYATSGSGRVMKSPSRGTIRSCPVRPGKYARANISRKRCRAAGAAASAGCVPGNRRASLPEVRSAGWPESVQAVATSVRAKRTAPQAVNRETVAKVRGVVMSPPSASTSQAIRGHGQAASVYEITRSPTGPTALAVGLSARASRALRCTRFPGRGGCRPSRDCRTSRTACRRRARSGRSHRARSRFASESW